MFIFYNYEKSFNIFIVNGCLTPNIHTFSLINMQLIKQ
uniref:Uncharacterized protein n=1 Tax=Heterorhabditis bacteriophora TaxID=37862 RepID=A0A1I7WE47_HETBA